MEKPAILNGKPAFSSFFPLTKPTLPDYSLIEKDLKKVYESGMLTNFSYVQQFETEMAKYLNVKHVVATGSCTSGLILTLKCFNITKEVIVPANTFVATVNAIIFAGCKPILVDVDPDTFNIDPKKVEEAINENTQAIIGVHLYGNPCDYKALYQIKQKHNLKLIFDAAHVIGKIKNHDDLDINFSPDAQSHSLSPTKLLPVGEGGLVSTNNDKLAKDLKNARNYGLNGNDMDANLIGINARMQEFSAVLGLFGLKSLDHNIKHRNELVNIFKNETKNIKGIKFQKIINGEVCSYKDFSLLIQESKFGLSRDDLVVALTKENIQVKKYFYPPIHEITAYGEMFNNQIKNVPIADYTSKNSISIPCYSHMKIEDMKTIAKTINNIYMYREEIKNEIRKNNSNNPSL